MPNLIEMKIQLHIQYLLRQLDLCLGINIHNAVEAVTQSCAFFGLKALPK